MKLSVCLIVGDNQTLHCGVKDYAIRLGQALEEIGLNVEVSAPDDWGMNSFRRFTKELRQRKFDIVHVQYPSIGNRSSLGPHILGWMKAAKRSVVTLHEYSALPVSQRTATHLFGWSADRMLFTAEAEAAAYGSLQRHKHVIPIGSNVPAYIGDVARTPTVLYFGQIRPDKGLEDFLELARMSLQRQRPFKFLVIGSVPSRRAAYFDTLRPTAMAQVEWLIDLPMETVAEKMVGSLAAYLPYPDGASYRRGSLIAALTNGLPAITRIGAMTPQDMSDVLLPSNSPAEALMHLERLYSSPAEGRALGDAGRTFAARFSWAEIARQHEKVYRQALSPATASASSSAIA